MRRSIALVSMLAVLGVLAASEGWAQRGPRWQGSGGWGPHGGYMRLYDPKTVESVTGEVTSVDLLAPMTGMSTGVHLTLKTETGSISVHLGPSWYLEKQDMKIVPKDRVEIKGARVTLGGKPALIAAQVTKGDEVLTLRDEAGFPAWSAMRRR